MKNKKHFIKQKLQKLFLSNCSLHGLSLQSRSHSDSGEHKEYAEHYTKPVPTYSEVLGVVLISNDMARNRHHR